jgi:hypothetical protein
VLRPAERIAHVNTANREASMHPRKALAQLLVCSGLLLSACGGPKRAAAPAPEPSPEPVVVRFEEGPCSFDIPAGVQAESGYVVVPED